MKLLLEQLLNKEDLSFEIAFQTMSEIMSGNYTDIQISGFLIALRSKGESIDEIAGFAKAMREKMIQVTLTKPAIDMCGTGGDSSGTFNISTASSFVVAGSGINVAKHGNRSMTSKSGSADVLEALGINVNNNPEESAKNIDQIGLDFLFAPAYHPAMKFAIPSRKGLAVRTVFNILGPLCNPANVTSQTMGVFHKDYISVQAKVLKALKSKNVMIFHGKDGLDEISTTANTLICEMRNGTEITNYELNPEKFGIKKVQLNDLKGGSPEQNAKIIINILNGEKSPMRDIVLINAASGIIVGNKAKNFNEAIDIARESIDSGKAKNILEKLST